MSELAIGNRSRTIAVLVGLIVFAATWLAAPQSAQAGYYKVEQCDEHNDLAHDAQWTGNVPTYALASNCATATRQMYIYNWHPMGTTGWRALRWIAPSGTYIVDGNATYYLRSDSGHDAYLQIGAPGGGTNGYILAPQGGWRGGTLSIGTGHHTHLSFFLNCSRTAGCPQNSEVRSTTGRIRLRLNDTSPPQIGAFGGTITGNPARGVVRLTVPASDAGTGIVGATVKVNGTTISSPTVCTPPFYASGATNRFRPCPGSHTFQLDTNTEEEPWRQGSNQLEVCVRDYSNTGSAGPNQPCKRATINVDNSCPKSATSVQPTSISAQVESEKGRSGTTVIARSNENVAIHGTVRSSAGPVGGALVCVYERVNLPGELSDLVNTGYTRPNGTYRISVDDGPSRSFEVASRNNHVQVNRRGLMVHSRAVPVLKVPKKKRKLRNGQKGRFKGKIPGGAYAADRAIALQAAAGRKCKGKGKKRRCKIKWRTFKQLRTKGGGHFKAKYRFTNTRGQVVYKFRAVAKNQGGYPYLRGASKKKKVKVRG